MEKREHVSQRKEREEMTCKRFCRYGLTVLFKVVEILMIIGLCVLFVVGFVWAAENAFGVVIAFTGVMLALPFGAALWPYNWKLTGKIFKEKD